MLSFDGFNTLDKKAPGRVADWSVGISPLDPLVTAALQGVPPFGGLDAAAGALLGAAQGEEPPPLMKFDRAGHYATIDIDAQAGLSGGGFTLVLQRAMAGDYDKLALVKAACDKKNVPLVAKVSLGWSANRGFLGLAGPSSDGLHPVGTFAITEIQPAVDGVVYRITLRGRELFAHRLSQRRVTKAVESKTPEEAAAAVLNLVGFSEIEWKIDTDNPVTPPQKPSPKIVLALGQDGLTEVQRLGSMIEAVYGREGRKPFLVRDGVLHIGVARAIPFNGTPGGGKVIRVSAETGLHNYTETAAAPRDPKFDFAEAFSLGQLAATPEMRRGFRLELVGAPEIHPGDVVAFPPSKDPTATSILDLSIAEDWTKAVELYVNTVSHRIDPNAGFMTIVTGVQVETSGGKPTSLWDVPSKAPVRAKTKGTRSFDDGTAEGALSASVLKITEQAMATMARPDIGEVTDTVPATGGDPAFLPLSSNMVTGIETMPVIMQRSAINPIYREGQAALQSIPYLSPFAWGPFGLVLPRYPGTRVMLLPGYGDSEDYVDVGALWHGTSDVTSARPQNAEPGDWWLKLPAGIEPSSSQDVLKAPVGPPDSAKATNDLTDAEGNRMIEVGHLVIRVGEKALAKSTDRPGKGDLEHAIVIEHKDGEALITIDKDGKVTIKAKEVAVEAPDGSVSVKAKNVAVEVSDSMNVKKA